ncbi:NAD-dependent epimerase/dehydratase family protein [Paludibacterium purpuratum]|uniref:Nucleoside-diphosphate-sugar epimerase n=1 Tax=Paludibacterium purpuratum TaxID=1144873 RepID=A0A4R7AUP6_9NEIS|nr:NAD-dependent epimerase/dehydratase family protein [Paludibacterium purpuratum]TDR70727.1 nucleoside-diphosphate-sugar epimerase [Paludibacterium purpuratum]
MQTLLIAGLGDVARRAIPLLRGHWRLLALTHTPEARRLARELGVRSIAADLDRADSLGRLAALAQAILYTAPPPSSGEHDPRLLNLLSALRKANSIPQRLVYISTSGVYGDYGGQWIDECAPCRPRTARARRRLAAEKLLRHAAAWPMTVTILRAPGIYAEDRLPLDRLRAGTPAAIAADDGFGNHIHADDLARLCARALRRKGGIRIYNACDDEPLRFGDWFDLLADRFALPRPPRLPLAALLQTLSPMQASFLAESRRIKNDRLKRELGDVLRHRSARAFLATTDDALALGDKFR